MSNQIHTPVMLQESVRYLITDRNGAYFDGTAGFGGHLAAFLGTLEQSAICIATDTDETAIEACRTRFAADSRLRLYRENFKYIRGLMKFEGLQGFSGVYADLGVSSYQLDAADAGFSYRLDTPLDLRLDKRLPLTAAALLNTFEENEIADILYKFGEEKNSRKLARLIVEQREKRSLAVTADLVTIIESTTPPHFLRKTLSRVFQALRIYINDELQSLQYFLEQAIYALKSGGRVVLLSYHSLEDRIVKETFQKFASGCICPKDFPICVCGKTASIKILTKKPIVPDDEEVRANPRARSAKLRAAEKL